MPLIVLTGYPSTGRTLLADQLSPFLAGCQQFGPADYTLHVVHDESNAAFSRTHTYADSAKEKEHRSFLRSAVQRLLSKNCIVIVDALNDVKGFRSAKNLVLCGPNDWTSYELHCAARLVQTTQCTIWLRAKPETALAINQTSNAYDPSTISALVARYEEPVATNRWDAPLHIVDVDYLDNETVGKTLADERQSLFQLVADSVFKGSQLTANRSTTQQPTHANVHDVDRLLAQLCKSLVERCGQDFQPGQPISIANPIGADGEPIVFELNKRLTLAQLTRLRRQHIPRLTQIERPDAALRLFADIVNKSAI